MPTKTLGPGSEGPLAHLPEGREKAGDPRARSAHLLRRGPGRETLLVELEGGGAEIRKRHSKARAARREDETLRALAGLGLRVPEALGWRREAGGGTVAMGFVPHELTLRELLSSAGARERSGLAAELLAIVLRLHGAGWFHRDLYLEHFLVRSTDRALVLIDVGRARRRRRPRRRWLVKDLAALLHSTPPSVSRAERLRFLHAYLQGRGAGGARKRRSWARAVLRKEGRMARHRPRAGESYPLPERWRGA